MNREYMFCCCNIDYSIDNQVVSNSFESEQEMQEAAKKFCIMHEQDVEIYLIINNSGGHIIAKCIYDEGKAYYSKKE